MVTATCRNHGDSNSFIFKYCNSLTLTIQPQGIAMLHNISHAVKVQVKRVLFYAYDKECVYNTLCIYTGYNFRVSKIVILCILPKYL